ncbi:MAG: hypothetical protein HFH22_07470 [Ruminococcus sp.]|nr:hypothetical protein [Ruminococcus sp.]MCI9329631.1 hypothetical protein [Ruminococcus sp.]
MFSYSRLLYQSIWAVVYKIDHTQAPKCNGIFSKL